MPPPQRSEDVNVHQDQLTYPFQGSSKLRPTESKHKSVIVLGMHRSGTSACFAGVISLLGVDLGSKLLPPRPDNPKGYWEHAEIYDTHERMLNCLGRVWHSLFPFPDNWWKDASLDRYRRRLIDTVRNDFGQSPLWGLKDPRMCRLLPMWHDVFPEVACEPHFIITVRNPVEVFRSLARRDGFSQTKCSLMWLLHTLESERETRMYKRVFVKDHDLLVDWRSTMLRISEYFGLDWPTNLDSVSDEIAEFLEPSLKHHSTGETRFSESAFAEYLEPTHRILLQAAESSSESLGEDSPTSEGINKAAARLAVI